jgi:hypothetical protein
MASSRGGCGRTEGCRTRGAEWEAFFVCGGDIIAGNRVTVERKWIQ